MRQTPVNPKRKRGNVLAASVACRVGIDPSLARFDGAPLSSCPQCARQIGRYVCGSHGLFRPFRCNKASSRRRRDQSERRGQSPKAAKDLPHDHHSNQSALTGKRCTLESDHARSTQSILCHTTRFSVIRGCDPGASGTAHWRLPAPRPQWPADGTRRVPATRDFGCGSR
jgi:hypothetical protein